MVDLPNKCPHCGERFGMELPRPPKAHLIVRSQLDYHGEDESRLADEIYECSNCHTLFRAIWRMREFNELYEKVGE